MTQLSVEIEAQAGGFSLQVGLHVEGGTAGILGASGAGKTLTLRAIAGLLRPHAGRIVLDGQPVFDHERKIMTPARLRRIGYVFQQYALFPHLTVAQNLAYGLGGWPKDQRTSRMAELVELLRLHGMEDRRPAGLSGGQQQRVALGRALARNPALMLLDEPFSALDTPTRAALTEQFQELQERLGFTALLVTHDVAEAYALSSYLVVLDQGRVIQQGPSDQVFRKPASPQAARVLGIRNLLPGTVVGADGQKTQVAVDGIRLRAGPSELKPGTAVTVGIRPQEVTVQPSSPAVEDAPGTPLSGWLSGRLVKQLDRGAHRELLLELRGLSGAGPQLYVELDLAAHHTLGPDLPTEWRVTIPPSAVHLWAGQGATLDSPGHGPGPTCDAP
jgi:ABC-type sulfate/molybdate transport systems ATPase subunit